jgi:hypothetical protein
MKNYFIFFIIINLTLLSNAHAYVDSGSASIVIHNIIGLIAYFIATIKLWCKKFTNFFSKIFKQKRN